MRLLSYKYKNNKLRITGQWEPIRGAGDLGSLQLARQSIIISSNSFPAIESSWDGLHLYLRGTHQNRDRDSFSETNKSRIETAIEALEILSKVEIQPRETFEYVQIGDSFVIRGYPGNDLRSIRPKESTPQWRVVDDIERLVVVPVAVMKDIDHLQLSKTMEENFYSIRGPEL